YVIYYTLSSFFLKVFRGVGNNIIYINRLCLPGERPATKQRNSFPTTQHDKPCNIATTQPRRPNPLTCHETTLPRCQTFETWRAQGTKQPRNYVINQPLSQIAGQLGDVEPSLPSGRPGAFDSAAGLLC